MNVKTRSLLDAIDFRDTWVRVICSGIILIIICVVFFTPKNEISKVNAYSNSIPKEVGTDVEVLYSDSARVKAKLNTPEMIRYIGDDPIMEMPKGLHVAFFGRQLDTTSTLKANYGIRYLKKFLTIVRGNVVIVNANGETINTEELIWEENKDSVKSDKFIKIKKKDEIILAQGFTSDLTFTHYKFYKIKGTIYLDNSKDK